MGCQQGGRQAQRAVPSSLATWCATMTATATSSFGRNPLPATSPTWSGNPRCSDRRSLAGAWGDDVGEGGAVGLVDLDTHRCAEVVRRCRQARWRSSPVTAPSAAYGSRSRRRRETRRRRPTSTNGITTGHLERAAVVAPVRRGGVEHGQRPRTSIDVWLGPAQLSCCRGALLGPLGRAPEGCRHRPAWSWRLSRIVQRRRGHVRRSPGRPRPVTCRARCWPMTTTYGTV